jgi:phage antirepressor YoqD-like protein
VIDLEKTEEIATSGRPFVSDWSKNTILALIAEVRALREDAERYRYLRERRFYYADNPNTSMYHKAGVDSGYLHVKTIDREGLDAAIDVARKEKA